MFCGSVAFPVKILCAVVKLKVERVRESVRRASLDGGLLRLSHAIYS